MVSLYLFMSEHMNAMKNILTALCTACAAFACLFPASAQEQQEKMPSIPELAEKEADRLEEVLSLEPWQTFYVDSILQHDYAAMTAELDELKASKVSNTSFYVMVQDKWLDRIDEAYGKLFSPEQWAAYLKQGAGKAQKLRAKRRAKGY